MLYTISSELHLFDTFAVDSILECRIISVSEEARGRGLAKELMKRSIDIAKEHEFKVSLMFINKIKTRVRKVARYFYFE